MTPILRPTSAIIETLLESINSAHSEILLQMFYFDNDDTGKRFIHALTAKAAQGVKVTCLLDALGGHGLVNTTDEKAAILSGVRFVYFNWLTPWASGQKRFWYFRNHKRTLIIDNKFVHIGGWCIGDKPSDWIDNDIRIEDQEVVAKAVSDFNTMRNYAHRTSLKFKHESRYTFSREKNIAYTYQAPLPKARYIYYTFLKLIREAKNNITLVAPYFSPSHKLIRYLKQASQRGVKITLIRPSETDHRVTDMAARTYFDTLLRHEIDIYLCQTMVHAKVSVFDDVAYVGTSNLDSGSLKFNFENGVFTTDANILTTLKQDMENLKPICQIVSLEEWRKRSLWQKFLERLVRLIRGWL